VDLNGYIYVTGFIQPPGYPPNYATLKYDSNGDTMWVRTYTGLNDGSSDAATDVKVDNSGNVYVTGTSSGDYVTIKYSSVGDTIWTRRYTDGSWPVALAIDDSGNAFVTGGSGGVYSDFITIKYNQYGETLWTKRYDGPDSRNDFALSLKLDAEGNAYVTGQSRSYQTGDDWVTIKYSPCSAIPGDANSTSDVTLGDIIHLVNYTFDKNKLPCLGIDPGNCWTPDLFCRGDVNQTGTITLGDIIHLVNFIFDKDRLPCLGSNPGNCWTPEANGACCQPVP
jgi:hypothetical protein